jgi:hypothetical protein
MLPVLESLGRDEEEEKVTLLLPPEEGVMRAALWRIALSEVK